MSEPTNVRFEFQGEVWFYRNPNAVYFVSLPKEMSADILDLVGTSMNPWGTVPVSVTIGDFTWTSSMFPRPEKGCYDLPLNLKVRRKLKIEADQVVKVAISIPISL